MSEAPLTNLGAIRIFTVPAGTPVTRDGVTHVVEDDNIVFDGRDAYVTPKVSEQIASFAEAKP